MRRTIVEPADLSGLPLDDLKSWLGITRPNEDQTLQGLLATSLAQCEAMTGLCPLAQTIEERVPAQASLSALSSRPVQSLVRAELIEHNGVRSSLDGSSYELQVATDQSASFELKNVGDGQAVAVQIRVGIADTWADVPAALRQGIVRLAAHLYTDRGDTARSSDLRALPATVVALWLPWRRLGLT